MKDKDIFPDEEQWSKIQQLYWDMWLAISNQLLQHKTQQANVTEDNPPPLQAIEPWIESIELWWQVLSSVTPTDNQTVLRKFIDQGKNYFQFNNEFIKAFQTLINAPAETQESITLIEDGLRLLQENLLNYLKEKKNIPGFWDLPLDNWGHTLSLLSAFPGDFLQNLNAQVKSEEITKEKMTQLLSMPAIGYTREWQTRLQKGLQLLIAHQTAQRDYSHQFQRIVTRTIELLRDKLIHRANKAQPIDNLRCLYNEWVDCGELAYAEIVTTEEYSIVNARLINSLMAWKRHEQQTIDEILGALNMPTRRGLNTLHKRMQEMRREIKKTAMEEPLQTKEVLSYDDLKDEIKALRAEIELIKRADKKATLRHTTKPTKGDE
ncbi:class III poly(R)-hydroxyalkanoic acid synthase subunit PhaE [Beggiatoa leptomitoformis]|uniref:Poly(3-hydroxyalkanoate) polymerase subunit PhaE n=1 Tax=Beggiatoa leptomitoformis TaxID=288004 RepID=A0A2N9YHW0_9GAMM|nr:class III poly(R)-hydroxyalkanoic acid synthase subunit PhaE [Beggiatoa leptomitoformis]ALG67766.1 class III poly(R)-hydroxyalkanoic acid synthase subunit PhaE [Beggiatoa leptomitoformis]AUI69989.1 class III poly(R)-hydroxyalkanoic acid synthase subunit PhaE [Beggiatoa leptomitoformis]